MNIYISRGNLTEEDIESWVSFLGKPKTITSWTEILVMFSCVEEAPPNFGIFISPTEEQEELTDYHF